MESLFRHSDYKAYLIEVSEGFQDRKRGFRTAMAEAIGCQPSFTSQVLNGKSHLSLEQGDRLNQFLGHSDQEAEFFLLLIQYARAGTASLREHLRRLLVRIREKRLIFKERLTDRRELEPSVQASYYSSWLPAAIHVMLSIPALRTVEALSRCLRVERASIERVLNTLAETGLAEARDGVYVPLLQNPHLSSDSPFLLQHHTNWRLQAVRAIENQRPNDLHYSSVASLSEEDFLRFRENMTQFIQETGKMIRQSREEVVCGICIDLFKLT